MSQDKIPLRLGTAKKKATWSKNVTDQDAKITYEKTTFYLIRYHKTRPDFDQII